MSTIKTAALRGLTGSADSIQLHTSDQSVTFPGNVTCSGTATGFGGGGDSGTDYNDGVKTRWGTGNDLEIYHTGGDYSYIKDNSGRAHVRSDRVYIQNNAGDENMIYAEADNGVYLYHNGTAQCNTITSGLDFPTGKGIALGAGAKQVDEADSPKDFNIVTQLANNITTPIIQINATVEEASDPAGEVDEGSPNLGLRDTL